MCLSRRPQRQSRQPAPPSRTAIRTSRDAFDARRAAGVESSRNQTRRGLFRGTIRSRALNRKQVQRVTATAPVSVTACAIATALANQQDRDRDRAKPRTPPDRGHLPDRFFAHPREYAFLPVDARLSFYYHPYFGFYYGPYYGPFYPYPGPFARPTRYSASTIRLRVSPVETEVYINGYYAGIVDDFDGVFQRLYLPAGGHHLELRLVGYASYRQDVYVSPGDTLDVRHVMIRLAPGTNTAPPPEPGSLSPEWATAESDDRDGPPASPYGVLAVRTEPADAQIFIDGEAWRMTTAQQEFVLHLPAGWHRLEVRKDEYRTFTTTFESTPGHTTRLAVSLER